MSVCFPALCQVSLDSGEFRSISDLSPHENLQTVSSEKNSKALTRIKSSSFYTYLHFDKDATTEFLVLKCEHDLQLVISESHLLFKKCTETSTPKASMAKNVKIGDYLLHVNTENRVQNVVVLGIEKKICQGVFAPLTKSGSLIVDGFVVSCYAEVESQTKAHASLAPLRIWYQLRSKIGKPSGKALPKTGIHMYAKTLASLYGVS